MIKKMLFVICLICLALIVFSVVKGVVSVNNVSGKIVFYEPTAHQIFSIDLKTNEKKQLSFEDVKLYNVLGPYINGDYCFFGIDSSDESCIWFVKNGTAEGKIRVSSDIIELVANDNYVFFIEGKTLFSLNRHTQEKVIICNDITTNYHSQSILLNEENLFFIKDMYLIQKDLVNNNDIKCCKASSILGFETEKKILLTFDDEKYEYDYSNKKTKESFLCRRIVGPVEYFPFKNVFFGFYPTGEGGGFAGLKIVDKSSRVSRRVALDNWSCSKNIIYISQE